MCFLNRSRQSRTESPPERPSWGFGPSRAGSRMEDDFIDGFDETGDESDRGSLMGGRQSSFEESHSR
jgi:hypothetical protein